MADEKPRTLEQVRDEMQARIDSNYKAFIYHPDFGIRLKAEARSEAYRLMLAQVEEVLLSRKEVPLGQCTRCLILEQYTPEKTLFGGLCGKCDAEVDPAIGDDEVEIVEVTHTLTAPSASGDVLATFDGREMRLRVGDGPWTSIAVAKPLPIAPMVTGVCNGEFCTGCGNHEPV